MPEGGGGGAQLKLPFSYQEWESGRACHSGQGEGRGVGVAMPNLVPTSKGGLPTGDLAVWQAPSMAHTLPGT